MLWTPEGAAGPVPLILMGHGGGQHKKAPGVVARARCFVAEGGFAVASADVPNHGDRPKDAELDRIAAENQARVAAGEDAAPLVGLRRPRLSRDVLHANPGQHGDLPWSETDSALLPVLRPAAELTPACLPARGRDPLTAGAAAATGRCSGFPLAAAAG